jgi:MraZ protein
MQFLGSHQNRLDAKGRVSVPAPFRTTLRQAADSNGNGAATGQLILRPSHFYSCIEAWPPARFAALEAPLAQYSLLSPEHQDLATSIYADAFPIDVDKEGRILIPEHLVAHAGLSEAVLFMGVGPTFQIWEPAAAERRRAEARIRSRELAPHGGVAHAGASA